MRRMLGHWQKKQKVWSNFRKRTASGGEARQLKSQSQFHLWLGPSWCLWTVYTTSTTFTTDTTNSTGLLGCACHQSWQQCWCCWSVEAALVPRLLPITLAHACHPWCSHLWCSGHWTAGADLVWPVADCHQLCALHLHFIFYSFYHFQAQVHILGAQR